MRRKTVTKTSFYRLMLISCLFLAHQVSIPTKLFAHGDVHAQIAALDEEILRDPSNAELYLKRGELHRVHGTYELALKDYDQALLLNPKLEVIHYCKGQLFLHFGLKNKAQEALEQFLKNNPTHEGALICRARARALAKHYELAVDDYSSALALNPKNPELYLEKADALAASARPLDAVKTLDAGIAAIGPLVVLQLRAVDLQVALRDFDQALARIDVLEKQSSRKESWHERRGHILTIAGRMAEARQAYSASLFEIEKLAEHQRHTAFTRELEKRVQSKLAELK